MDFNCSQQKLQNIPRKEFLFDTDLDLFNLDETFQKLSELPPLNSFLDLDLDSSLLANGYEGFQELNLNMDEFSCSEKSYHESAKEEEEEEEEEAKSRRKKKSVTLEMEEIQKHFGMPITKAAKELKIGVTALKKRCRELNIKRWPHRKLKSLNHLIHNVKEMGLNTEIGTLEEHRRIVESNPDVYMPERIKRLRQACFKANFKKKQTLLSASFLN